MSADKNHEQYLEEIEIAVAQTTKALMEEHNSDLRKLAKVCAEKQLQVKRLKEFQENDRSTIRSLRVKLEQAIEEIECRNSTWETKEGEYEGEIAELKKEIEKYKEYPQQGGWEKALDNIKGMKDVVIKENHQLGKEIVELKEELDIAHFEYDKLKEEKYSLYLKWSELKEENNKLKGREIERVFGVSEEVFKKLLKECPPDPDDYK